MSKPKSSEERRTKSTVDTISFTPAEARAWMAPPFQRPLKSGSYKVRELSEKIASDGGVIPGVITVGKVSGDKNLYKVDGQHRIEAFLLSGKQIGYADCRTVFVEDMAELGEEFIRLNSQLVRMLPDDFLRALEDSIRHLRELRAICPFIGYGQTRRNNQSPLLSMSMVLRAWSISRQEVPGSSCESAPIIAKTLSPDDYAQLAKFLNICFEAWSDDQEYVRLWGSLNLIHCAWLYCRSVLACYSAKSVRLTDALFSKCMNALSADSKYLDWLVGRLLGDRDRAPCYTRITDICSKRLKLEGMNSCSFPRPPWSLGRKGRA